MKMLENGADVESAQSEVCWARIQFNVTRKEKKARRSKLRKRSVRWREKSRKTADWVGMRWECCWQAVRCREERTWQEGDENLTVVADVLETRISIRARKKPESQNYLKNDCCRQNENDIP